MARGPIAAIAAFACALRCAASSASDAPGRPGPCLTVQSRVAAPVVLGFCQGNRSLANQTLEAGATASFRPSSPNETLLVVPAGADWSCELGCADCFELGVEAPPPPPGPDGPPPGPDAPPNPDGAGPVGAGAAANATEVLEGLENSTVASIRLEGGASGSGCMSAVLEGPAGTARPTPLPLLRAGASWWHGAAGGWRGPWGGYHWGWHGGYYRPWYGRGGGGGCRSAWYPGVGWRRVCGGYHWR